jgi:hypothetical protein
MDNAARCLRAFLLRKLFPEDLVAKLAAEPFDRPGMNVSPAIAAVGEFKCKTDRLRVTPPRLGSV